MSFTARANAIDIPGDASGRAFLRALDSSGNASEVVDGENIGSKGGLMGAWKARNSGLMARMDRFGDLAISQWTPLSVSWVTGPSGIAENVVETTPAVTTFARAASLSSIWLSSTSSVSGATGAHTTSSQRFSGLGAPIRASMKIFADLRNGSAGSFGFGNTGGAALLAGTSLVWRFGPDGSVVPMIYTAGVANSGFSSAGTNISTLLDALGNWRSWWLEYVVEWHPDCAIFICSNPRTGQIISRQRIGMAIGDARLANVTHMPVHAQVANISSGFSSIIAPQFAVSDQNVSVLRSNWSKPWPEVLAGINNNVTWTPAGAQLASYTNSAAPASGTRSNTAAAYGTAMGGQWQFAAVASAEQDNVWFSMTPSAVATTQYYITGLTIDVINMGAANSATVPTVTQWSVIAGGNSVNLSTGVHSRIPVGIIQIPINAAIGQKADNSINVRFDVPLVVDQNRQLILVMKNVSGAATASQIIRGIFGLNGYQE